MSARQWIQGWLAATAALHGEVDAALIRSFLAAAGFEGPEGVPELRNLLSDQPKTATTLIPYLQGGEHNG